MDVPHKYEPVEVLIMQQAVRVVLNDCATSKCKNKKMQNAKIKMQINWNVFSSKTESRLR